MAHLSMNYKSQSLLRNISMEIFLPYEEGLPNPEQPYKTFYFLPGFSSSSKELSTFLNFRLHGLMKGIAVVIIDGDNSFYVDKPERFEMYSQFITREILEVTRGILPLSSKREDTYIGGISMGGYGALVNGLKNSESFSKIAMMSPGFDFYKILDNGSSAFTQEFLDGLFGDRETHLNSINHPETAILASKNEGKEIPEMFICCGQEDELVYDNDVDFINILKENNIPVEFIEESGGHDVLFWDKMMDNMFSFLAK